VISAACSTSGGPNSRMTTARIMAASLNGVILSD
jgi:hypothetical protein